MLKIKKLLASIAAIAMMNSYIPFLAYADVTDDVKAISIAEGTNNKMSTYLKELCVSSTDKIPVILYLKDIDKNEIARRTQEKLGITTDEYIIEDENGNKVDFYYNERIRTIREYGTEMVDNVIEAIGIGQDRIQMTSADKRLISCNLTPDEIAIAVNDDNVKNIDYRKYDIRWRDHDDPLDYTVRPEEKIADALYDAMEKTTERINVIVWFKPINEDERAKKISEILSSNNEETIVYDEEGNIDIKATEFAKVDSWSAANIKAVNEIMEETAANFIDALGIQDNDIISASKFARAMSCNLTPDMIIEASKIDNVSQITINDLKEAFDSIQPATTDATTDNSSSVPVSDLKTPFAGPSNIMGDLNESWTITLADALTLLQFIANEEKYPLTEQQQKNADCYNPGDGITAMDAKAIISVVTNEVVCLPVIEK